MSNDEFWFGEPRLTKVYREAHEIRNEIRNQELWVQGRYNYQAFTAVIEALASGLSGSKGGQVSQYPTEPFPLTERAQRAELERNKQRTLAWVKDGQH